MGQHLKNKNKRTTLKDISNETGFSITTVSLVLNNKPSRISDTVKEKIITAAKEMGYRPNQTAIGLVKQRSTTIGLIVSNISNTFYANLTKGIEIACKELGYNVILCNTDDKFEACEESIQILADKGVDGIILGMSTDMDEEKAHKSKALLESNKIPFIFVDRFFFSMDCPTVIADNILGGFLATDHLIKMGHKKIACITGPTQLSDARDRVIGYKRALKAHGIKLNENYIIDGDYSMKSGMKAFDDIQQLDTTGVFSSSGLMAIGFYKEARKNHYRIPSDYSLVSYDDYFYMDLMEVPFTTIKQPIFEMGKACAQKIVDLIKGVKEETNYTILPPQLIIRESVKKIN